MTVAFALIVDILMPHYVHLWCRGLNSIKMFGWKMANKMS